MASLNPFASSAAVPTSGAPGYAFGGAPTPPMPTITYPTQTGSGAAYPPLESMTAYPTQLGGSGAVYPPQESTTAYGTQMGGTSQAEKCVCGNIFYDDSLFCRKCGTKRPVGAQASTTMYQTQLAPLPPPQSSTGYETRFQSAVPMTQHIPQSVSYSMPATYTPPMPVQSQRIIQAPATYQSMPVQTQTITAPPVHSYQAVAAPVQMSYQSLPPVQTLPPAPVMQQSYQSYQPPVQTYAPPVQMVAPPVQHVAPPVQYQQMQQMQRQTQYYEQVTEVPEVHVEMHEKLVEVPEPIIVDRIIEIPQIQEVISEIPAGMPGGPRLEVVLTTREVPKVEIKQVERIIETPEIEFVDRIVEIPIKKEVIRRVPRIVVHEIPIERIIQVPKKVIHEIEQPVYRPVPHLMRQPVHRDVCLPKMQQTQTMEVVRQHNHDGPLAANSYQYTPGAEVSGWQRNGWETGQPSLPLAAQQQQAFAQGFNQQHDSLHQR